MNQKLTFIKEDFMSKMTFSKALPLATFALSLNMQPAMAKQHTPKSDDILGDWSIIDDVFGSERAVGRILRDKKTNKYYMKIVYNNTKMVDAKTHCVLCPGKFKDKPILNMVVMWNVEPVKGKPHHFKSGYGIDAYEGKLFKGTMKLSRNKNVLKVRATPLETSFVGKRFIFVRKKY